MSIFKGIDSYIDRKGSEVGKENPLERLFWVMKKHPHTPIIFLTEKEDSKDVDVIISDKPFMITEISSVCEEGYMIVDGQLLLQSIHEELAPKKTTWTECYIVLCSVCNNSKEEE